MIDQFLGRFKEIADAGPAEDQDVLQSMITHEKSFLHWIEKETAGEEGLIRLAGISLQLNARRRSASHRITLKVTHAPLGLRP
jgi:hypothetical protein